MMENVKDVQKLLKYVKLYEKVHKDNLVNDSKKREHNSVTRFLIEGEFKGLVKAYQSSDSIILKEDNIFFGKQKRRRKKKPSTNT